MARGILDLEVWLSRKAARTGRKEEKELPSDIDRIQEKASGFFSALDNIESSIVKEIAKEHGGFVAPEALPKPNLCGYTTTAIAEFFREKGYKSRVVYGHHRTNGDISYHYWTEIDSGDRTYVIDATYGQFDSDYSREIAIYPADRLADYGLREYKQGDDPILGYDRNTVQVLEQNGGLLPIRQEVNGDCLQMYESLVGSLD